VLLTHPDEDHINGMGKVMRGLTVRNLLIHRPAQHGYPGNTGAEPAEELVALATAQGAKVIEPFTGVSGFGDTFLIAGPTESYYREQLTAQEQTTKAAVGGPSLAHRYGAPIVRAARQVLDQFPTELFFDDAGGTNPRNNSAAILSVLVDGQHLLFPSDAGVPAITQALDFLDGEGRTNNPLNMLALPHHGSRHNLDRDTIQRLLGDATSERRGVAIASVSAAASKVPSPRVANAAGRRGYPVFTTEGTTLLHSQGGVDRGWTTMSPLPPLVETDHD
jgi:beta-lactamase superfamily II metal-dependent hydrolase